MAALLVPAAASAASRRPDVTKMTCREATGLVDEAGAIVLSTGRFTYGIFAENAGRCAAELGVTPQAAIVKTLDNPSCMIGVECKDAVLGRSGGTSIIGTSVGGCSEGDRVRARRKDKFVISPEEFVCRGGRWEEVEI